MKKNYLLKAVALGLFLVCSSVSKAQVDLNNVLGNVLGAATGNETSSQDLISNLTSVFSSDKQAKAENVIGTWSCTCRPTRRLRPSTHTVSVPSG